MMGRQSVDQGHLFYRFDLDEGVPAGHLLRRMNPFVSRALADLHRDLAAYYSHTGRPSIDPELNDPDADRRLLLWHPVGAPAVRGSIAEPGVPLVLPP